MIVLKAIGSFFARIGRWIRDTAWVQPLLIVGGIFAIIFSIPSITKWVQSWFTSGDAAVSFYKNSGYLKLDNGDKEGVNSSADDLLSFIFSDDSEKTDAQYKKYGEKFFVTFVQEDCSECSNIYKGWKAAKDNWGKSSGFTKVKDTATDTVIYTANKNDFKMYTIFVDQLNSDDENIFWKLHDKTYSVQFSDLSVLETPYSVNANVSYDGLASSEKEDLSGGSVFTTPTTLLFDRAFAEQSEAELVKKGYSQISPILNYKISEILFSVPDKAGQASGTPVAKARTLWDCWNHIGQFDNQAEDRYISE